MNLEKQRGSQYTIGNLVVDDKYIADQTHILEHIREFYKTLFKTWKQETVIEMETFFSDVDIPKLFENQVKFFEEDLTEEDLYNFLKNLRSDKFPSNDGLTKEFYETFWNEMKEV